MLSKQIKWAILASVVGAFHIPVSLADDVVMAETPPAAIVVPDSGGVQPSSVPTPPAIIPVPVAPRADIQVRQLSSIEFGAFATENGGGSVTVSPANSRSPGGRVSLFNNATYGAAEYEITGSPQEMVIVILPEQVILNRSAAGGEASITNLTIMPGNTLTLDESGHARVKVGGTLSVSGGVAPGTYSGNFDLDVRYLR